MRSVENVYQIYIFHLNFHVLSMRSVENEACVIWKLTNNL